MGEPTVNEAEARERLVSLFDDGVFTEIDAFAKSANGDVEPWQDSELSAVLPFMRFHKMWA